MEEKEGLNGGTLPKKLDSGMVAGGSGTADPV